MNQTQRKENKEIVADYQVENGVMLLLRNVYIVFHSALSQSRHEAISARPDSGLSVPGSV